MAVYTRVASEDIATFLERYDVGTLRSAKGIAEGVENSNYLIETSKDRYILTLYEKRVDPADLPFFIALLDHLAERGLAVPPMIADKNGEKIQTLAGRTACLIRYLPGISLTQPTAEQALSAGRALGDMHLAAEDFSMQRANSMGPESWHALAEDIGADALQEISPGLADVIAITLADIDAHWPADAPKSPIHADLFPDNVLMLGDDVTGIIDFYFSCTDIRAYDLAVTHSAWCFSEDGAHFDKAISEALLDGYFSVIAREPQEFAADRLTLLARGAALRFLLSRAYDWIHTPPDALVTRKDPMAFAHRLAFYSDPARANIFAA
ncbi:homoserine kinase [Alterisphingorhabdus coralli]|uniref:Homoserine kinase n=1 Tax=Alterisphingorhabdus coralli TaxID=3071408 RepID=A0AA97F5B0_9SPHN|nr:homoserine kinase [Parasphingorhabdus sp. SCSIO 66989]WOE74609.1 homoserine kinase [Parasphingorhabdus sp. SCSIO 66989]